MSDWIDRILLEFPTDLSRLWVAADPDDVLLNEQVLATLRERGFELLPFEDSVAFRAEYEDRYRSAWDRGEVGPSKALILQLRGTDLDSLPWDYLRQARRVSMSLATLFPKLSYAVVRHIGAEHHEALFAAQSRHAPQALGEASTKEFILTHIFGLNPHLIQRPADLWRDLLRLHYREAGLPQMLAKHVEVVLRDNSQFATLPLSDLFSSRSLLLRVVQDAWYRYLAKLGVTGTRTGEPTPDDITPSIDIPFEHDDVRVIVDSMFLDGLLHPLVAHGVLPTIPDWAKVGIVQDPLARRNLVADGIKGILDRLPTSDASHRDWIALARRWGEVLARYHALDPQRAAGLEKPIGEVQSSIDERLRAWVAKDYAVLPSLSPAKGPIMVHHVPRFLAGRRAAGEVKIALLVFDGLAIDQWVLIRETLAARAPTLAFDEGACFAWLPTLTSVSRQALFSGLKPREFGDTIESTSAEPLQWTRHWSDHGLRANEVLYEKSIKRTDQLDALLGAVSAPPIKAAGIVVDMVDEIVHGAMMGKRGVAALIEKWCESGFVDRLFDGLLDQGFHIYLTADHGNVEALGQGRPKDGAAPEQRGERVRIYRSENLAAASAATNPNTYRLDVAGLPSNFMPLFAGGTSAFMQQGEPAVVHGGVSVEELIVPFVKVTRVS